MRNLLQNKLVTGLVVLATFILAGVAVFTAIRLYQLRYQNVSPTSPEQSGATGNNQTPTPQSCTALTFTVPQGSPTPSTTGTKTHTPTMTPTLTASHTPTLSVTATSTITPTEVPRGGISETPTPTTPGNTTTVTPTAPPGTSATPVAGNSPTPSDQLPKAGIGLPTLFAVGLGGLILVLSIVLVL